MKGSHSDPVAESIRAEQNAAAAPTPEEARKKSRQALANDGCYNNECGETDPDNLIRTMKPQPELAQPDPDPQIVVCTECKDDVMETLQERAESRDEWEREQREKRSR